MTTASDKFDDTPSPSDLRQFVIFELLRER
jgi:hypothetical protein